MSVCIGVASWDFVDAVDAWHDSDSDLELHEWLGMTLDEYRNLVELRLPPIGPTREAG